VHIHTETPGTVLNYATALGSLRQISITNMQDQHEDFLDMHAQGNSHVAPELQAASVRGSGRDGDSAAAQNRIAVLVVASGPGLVEAFRSMGATAIIEGGQTMNPSTEQILQAIERVPQNEVILLPNNSNIIMAARQTAGLTKKRVAVVPTDTIPRGMAALIAYSYVGTLEDNVEAMQEAASRVETGEITRAVRDARVNDIEVKSGSVIGLHNNTLVTTGSGLEEVAWDLLERMGVTEAGGDRELVTVYSGSGVTPSDAQALAGKIRQRYPNVEVELVNGGQPFYDYIISAE
jgi:dihydroxyacetone kinase-like predicted kinase